MADSLTAGTEAKLDIYRRVREKLESGVRTTELALQAVAKDLGIPLEKHKKTGAMVAPSRVSSAYYRGQKLDRSRGGAASTAAANGDAPAATSSEKVAAPGEVAAATPDEGAAPAAAAPAPAAKPKKRVKAPSKKAPSKKATTASSTSPTARKAAGATNGVETDQVLAHISSLAAEASSLREERDRLVAERDELSQAGKTLQRERDQLQKRLDRVVAATR